MSNIVMGKVAKLINDTELAINKGTDDGIKSGMTIWIIDESTTNILDPDTGENLGGVSRAKIRMRITGVGKRAAIAERWLSSAYESILGRQRTIAAALGTTEKRDKGRENPDEWSEGVKVGDRFISEAVTPDDS